MSAKILFHQFSARMQDFLYSFICEEECRICKHTMIARVQLLEHLIEIDEQVRPAILHRWINEQPHYSRTICETCWARLSSEAPLMGFYDNEDDKSFPIVSGASYAGTLRDLIHTFKYEGDRLLAPDLASIMLSGWRMGSIFLERKDAILVPIPLFWKKRIERGFNQAELLANEASKILDIPVVANGLQRKRATTPQQSLEKLERFTNVGGAFLGNQSKLKGRTVILIDDVCTSGATLAECVNEVTRCGATKVVALTVARTILRKGLITGQSTLTN